MYVAYLEIKNPNVRSDPHQRLIEIISFSFGPTASSSAGAGVGSSSGSGNTKMKNVHITRNGMDEASAPLFQACANGGHFGEVIITVYKDDSAATKPTLTYTLMQCLIDSFTSYGAPDNGKVIEQLSFSFTTYKIEYL